jgi:hypothetical protein
MSEVRPQSGPKRTSSGRCLKSRFYEYTPLKYGSAADHAVTARVRRAQYHHRYAWFGAAHDRDEAGMLKIAAPTSLLPRFGTARQRVQPPLVDSIITARAVREAQLCR